MLSASHNVNTKRASNQSTWHLYDINLPPTSSNASGSHGFVYFRIKPRLGYAIGDVIPNTASIYFDYNPAIITNRFDTEFVQELGNATFSADTISLYPNSTSELVSISNSNPNDKIATIVIYEISGKIIYTLNKNMLNTISIDVSHFAQGLYLVELSSESNTKITKKLLIK
ncbi:T9SS type A sorting domain-containing protein [Flavobacterium sp.]|uniref:T9SS type A sorting domain-containing protein n=1 Tax=Flavobacterium sp. TaxID=239 RepID=UPI0026005011|nr:T9SS type A sorting domain-containing protein [Flavobacterium sp.]